MVHTFGGSRDDLVRALALAEAGRVRTHVEVHELAAAGRVLGAGRDTVSVPTPSAELWVSELLVSNDISTMPEAQQMLEPFAWQGIAAVRARKNGPLRVGVVGLGTGTLAYSSWRTMRALGTPTDSPTCAYNDFALVKVSTADKGKVNPSIPFWGGPTGIDTAGPRPRAARRAASAVAQACRRPRRPEGGRPRPRPSRYCRRRDRPGWRCCGPR